MSYLNGPKCWALTKVNGSGFDGCFTVAIYPVINIADCHSSDFSQIFFCKCFVNVLFLINVTRYSVCVNPWWCAFHDIDKLHWLHIDRKLKCPYTVTGKVVTSNMLAIIQNYDISSQRRDLLRDKEEYFLLCLKADLVVGKRDKLADGGAVVLNKTNRDLFWGPVEGQGRRGASTIDYGDYGANNLTNPNTISQEWNLSNQ